VVAEVPKEVTVMHYQVVVVAVAQVKKQRLVQVVREILLRFPLVRAAVAVQDFLITQAHRRVIEQVEAVEALVAVVAMLVLLGLLSTAEMVDLD
jgi:hypothetical protein